MWKTMRAMTAVAGATFVWTAIAEVPKLPPREEVAIQAKIDAAHAKGGGVVNIPPTCAMPTDR